MVIIVVVPVSCRTIVQLKSRDHSTCCILGLYFSIKTERVFLHENATVQENCNQNSVKMGAILMSKKTDI